MSTPGIRDIAWRFVAGEDLDAALAALRALNARGIKGTLSCVGTHVRDRDEAIAATDMAVESLRRIQEEGLDSHVSIKLTQIGLDIDEEFCRTQLRLVLGCAKELGNFVRIDMEESSYVEPTIRIFEEMRQAYGPDTVGIVLQSYLRQRRDDLERLVAGGSRIRLVKGGYWEPPDIVFRDKAAIDRAFQEDLELLLARGTDPAIATHDVRFLNATRRLAADHGRDRHAYEFQMLYGVRQDLQDALARQGHTVRCYVPYGGQWYEYVLGCIRRVPGGALLRLRQRVTARHRGLIPPNRSTTGKPSSAHALKRGLDVIGAATAIVILSPVLAWVALAVAAVDGLPILFRQRRPGLHGKPFTLYKFRTMRATRPGEVWYLTDAQRITRLGRILRSTSIDELPEFWNVLRGDMSLVGPRPLFMEYLAEYAPEERRRHEVRPGITGWAVVNGRNTLQFRDRLELDLWYVDHWSLALDARILALTVPQVLRRTNVTATENLALGFPLAGIDPRPPAERDAGAGRGADASPGSGATEM